MTTILWNIFMYFQGIWHISQPKAANSPVKGPSIYASQTQARPWGHAGLQPNQKSALYLIGGFGQTSISSWSWSGERRRKGRRKVCWQQPEQQSSSLCSRPGLSCGCWGSPLLSHWQANWAHATGYTSSVFRWWRGRMYISIARCQPTSYSWCCWDWFIVT